MNVKEFTEKKLLETHSVSGCLLSPWMPILRNNWRVWYQSCPLAGPFTAGQQRLLTILGRSREQRRSSDGKGLPCFLMTFVRVCCSSKETNCKTIITNLSHLPDFAKLKSMTFRPHHPPQVYTMEWLYLQGSWDREGPGRARICPSYQPSIKALAWDQRGFKGETAVQCLGEVGEDLARYHLLQGNKGGW